MALANHTILVSKDGTERAIADSGAPVVDEHGKIQGMVLVFRDVSEDRRSERTLRLLADHGIALVLVEQYVHRAMAMADHVVLLVRGRVSWSGPADGIDEERITREYLGTEVGGPR